MEQATSLETVAATKTSAMIDLVRSMSPNGPRRVLVVGCGSGAEASMLAKAFDAETVGIDISDKQFVPPDRRVKLMIMDARKMEFADASFDFVYSFHALEHIPQPEQALKEMARVLAPGGHYIVGTPNKARLVGYLGAPTPLSRKIKYNLKDFKMRLQGRWSNEAGAHAGFTESELLQLCAKWFGDAHSISDDYYLRAYQSRRKWVERLSKSSARDWVLPCVYVCGTATASSQAQASGRRVPENVAGA